MQLPSHELTNATPQEASDLVKDMVVDSIGQTNIGTIEESFKEIKDVNSALSLLKNLRAGSQISDSAHESLMQVFSTLSSKEQASHTKANMEAANAKQDSDAPDERALPVAGITVPKRKSSARPFKHPSSKRQQLTSEEAAEIYSMRPEVAKGSSLRRGCMVKSKMIAPNFGVTPKTVRDIWHARTWVSATRHLWTEDEIAHRAKGVSESDEEERNGDSSNSATPPPVSPTCDAAALSALQQQAMLAGLRNGLPALPSLQNPMVGLPMHFPFQPSNQVHLHNFGSVGRNPMGMPGLLPHAFPGLGQMGLPLMMPQQGLRLPEMSSLKNQIKA